MSFGEGDLHGKVEAQAKRIDNLMETNGKLCAEINRQEKRIRELEYLVRDFDLTAIEYVRKHDVSGTVRHDEAYLWVKTHIRQRIKELAIALDVRWNPDNAPLSMAVLQNALIELLTDDDDCGQIADMSQKSADCVRNDGKMSETGVSANAVDANDENATCNNSGDFVTDDSREKIEDDVCNWIHERRNHYAGNIGAIHQIYEWLNRQAEITRKTEQAAWIQQANGLIHEANVRADELRDELAKRDKGIARLKRQRDTARAKIDELEAECDTCCYKTDYIEMDFYDVDRLEAERDALAHDLHDCEQQREQLRQALGTAIDHAHEIVSLVNLDGEVIG